MNILSSPIDHLLNVAHYELSWIQGSTVDCRADAAADLFVHGMLETDTCWEALVRLIQPDHYLLPRFPWSAHNDPYWGNIMPGEEWIRQMMDSQGSRINGLYAHSFGCNATLQYLLESPTTQPRFLVLFTPFYHVEKEEIQWQTLEKLIGGLEGLITESIKMLDTRNRYQGELLKEMADRVRDKLGVYGWNQFFQAFLKTPDLPLSTLRCPTLVISGEHDHYCPVKNCEALASALPNGNHIMIPNAGHFLLQSHPAEIHHVISEFVHNLN